MKCDWCEKEIDENCCVKMTDISDGTEYYFCDWFCLKKWVQSELDWWLNEC